MLLVNPDRMYIAAGVFVRSGARFEVVPLSAGVRATGSLTIGADVQIEDGVHIAVAGVTVIGEGTVLARHVYVTDHDHGPATSTRRVMDAPLVVRPTTIGRDAWIGERACVLKGVRVGDGAVVGAGAVVTRDVPDGTVVAGVPAVAVAGRGSGPTNDPAS